MDSYSEKNTQVEHLILDFDERRRLANRYLNRITSLQDELHLEERKLIQLLKTYGLGIFSR